MRALLVAASELDPTLGAYVRLVAATGMRRAEACAVRWGDLDLDLEAKTLTVARSHVAVPGIRQDKETKTPSTRTVILGYATVGVLAQLRESRVEVGTDPELPVFTDDGGTTWRPDGASARWARVRKKAGVDKSIRLHDLRHWQATPLLDADVPLPTGWATRAE
ncbi:MAG: tyrosine-type recombinase/integrase [Sulfitobacter sp.]|nr:tyrosine-type recombinase/integrase [Sulfitobacter sp.]